MSVGLNPRLVAKPIKRSTSVCSEFYVYMTSTYLSNNFFAGTKVAMISSRQSFTKHSQLELQLSISFSPRLIVKTTTRSTSLWHKIQVFVIVVYIFNIIFASKKVAMLSSIQVLSKSVITWAPIVTFLKPKTHREAHDQIYNSML